MNNDYDRPTVGTDVSSDVVSDEATKDAYEFDRQRDSATVRGTFQPDQKPGGDATPYPRTVAAQEGEKAAEGQPDAVLDQIGDRHYCTECGKVAYVDEARATVQELARLRAMRKPPEVQVHSHHDIRAKEDVLAEQRNGDAVATPPDTDAPTLEPTQE